MKKLILFATTAMLLMASCNSKPKNTTTIISEDGKEKVTLDLNQMKDAAKDMEKMKDELGKLEPLSLDQLRALLPETLMGAKRSSYDVNSNNGAGMASGKYKLNDSTDLSLNIFDCAGPGGAGIYSLQYMGMMNMQQESEEEYTKTIDINGGKGFEHCDKSSNDCEVTFFSGGRFLVTLEGDNIGAAQLKEVAKGLNLK